VAQKEREGLSPVRLILSIVAAFLIWGFLGFGFRFATIIIASILIHEYGHYYWMGREGIKKRDMMMLPPFGAVAIGRESSPSWWADSKIALAGPAFGLIALFSFLLFFFFAGNQIWAASAALAAMINLFQLLPIAFLDGGCVLRAIFLSINYRLETLFIIMTVLGLIWLLLFFPPFIAILIGMLWFIMMRRESLGSLKATALEATNRLNNLVHARNSLNGLARALKEEPPLALKNFLDDQISQLEEIKARADRELSRPFMDQRQILYSVGFFVIITVIYVGSLLVISQYINFSPFAFGGDIIKYFVAH